MRLYWTGGRVQREGEKGREGRGGREGEGGREVGKGREWREGREGREGGEEESDQCTCSLEPDPSGGGGEEGSGAMIKQYSFCSADILQPNQIAETVLVMIRHVFM